MHVELSHIRDGLMQCRIRHHGAVLLTALIDPAILWPMAERLVTQTSHDLKERIHETRTTLTHPLDRRMVSPGLRQA